MKHKTLLIALTLVLTIPVKAQEHIFASGFEPSASITSVTTAPSPDGEGYRLITVTGYGFGAVAPEVVLFEDFEKPVNGVDPTQDMQIPLASPVLGAWTWRANTPKYAIEGDNVAMQLRDPDLPDATESGARPILRLFFDDQEDIYFSYSVKVPDGFTWPGAATEETFPTGFASSTWKFTWLTENNGIANDGLYDMCIPTSAGEGSLLIGGNDNDGTIGYVSELQSWWHWDNYNYFSFGQIADKVDLVENLGYIYYRSMSGKPGSTIFQRTNQDGSTNWNGDPAFRPNVMHASATLYYDQIRFPGWWGNVESDSRFNAYYDNIYVAIGENAFTRFEITDSENYAASKMVVTLPPVLNSWSDGLVELKINDDFFYQGKQFYLYFYDKDNNRSSNTGVHLTCLSCLK